MIFYREFFQTLLLAFLMCEEANLNSSVNFRVWQFLCTFAFCKDKYKDEICYGKRVERIDFPDGKLFAVV